MTAHEVRYPLWVRPAGHLPRYVATCDCHYGQPLLTPSANPAVVRTMPGRRAA